MKSYINSLFMPIISFFSVSEGLEREKKSQGGFTVNQNHRERLIFPRPNKNCIVQKEAM